MYLQIRKTKELTKPRGKETVITHIALYSDEWKYIKFVEHTPEIVQKLCDMKIPLDINQEKWKD